MNRRSWDEIEEVPTEGTHRCYTGSGVFGEVDIDVTVDFPGGFPNFTTFINGIEVCGWFKIYQPGSAYTHTKECWAAAKHPVSGEWSESEPSTWGANTERFLKEFFENLRNEFAGEKVSTDGNGNLEWDGEKLILTFSDACKMRREDKEFVLYDQVGYTDGFDFGALSIQNEHHFEDRRFPSYEEALKAATELEELNQM